MITIYSGHLNLCFFKKKKHKNKTQNRSPKNTKTLQGIKIHLMKLPTNGPGRTQSFSAGAVVQTAY